MIELRNISYSYPDSKSAALDSVSVNIKPGIITAIIGKTGSGKSTLAEIISGITAPDSGTITIDSKPIKSSKKPGIVFQYPEYQLFEDTVYNDIAYGPKNLGIKGDDLDKCVKDAAKKVGLSEALLSHTPFELSGGEKRLAAIAGILAMRPAVLILDEPAAGLDPIGCSRIFDIMHELVAGDPEMTVIFITHSMDDAAESADEIIALDNGHIAAAGKPREIFTDRELLKRCGLDLPSAASLIYELQRIGLDIGEEFTADGVYRAVCRLLERGDITIGRYIEADSPLHRADARSKIIATLIYSISVFVLHEPLTIGILTLFTAAAVFISNVPIRAMLKGLKPLRWFILFTVVMSIFTSDGSTLWQWQIFRITDNGIKTAVMLSLKFLLLVSGTSLMTLTTPPIALTDGLARLMKPLKLIKLPVDDIAMMISITLRFIPIFAGEAEKISKAQRARGASFKEKGFGKIKAILPMTVPLFISVLRKSEELALAMDARCYGKRSRRPRKKTRFHRTDILILSITALVCVFLSLFEICH